MNLAAACRWFIRPPERHVRSAYRFRGAARMADILSGRRVLVVEDEILILLMIEDILADLGCTTVFTAATVADALAIIDIQTLDAAMLDCNLGDSRSDPIAEALDSRGVPLFFATGYSDLASRERYAGRLVLNKPFDSAGVEASFKQVLLRPRDAATKPGREAPAC